MSACESCEYMEELGESEIEVEDKLLRLEVARDFLNAYTEEKVLGGAPLDDAFHENIEVVKDRDTSISYVRHALVGISEIDCAGVDCELATVCPRLMPLLALSVDIDCIIANERGY